MTTKHSEEYFFHQRCEKTSTNFVLEITSSPNTSPVTVSFIRPRADNKFSPVTEQALSLSRITDHFLS